MNLIKRVCDISIELTPYGADFLRIDFHIRGDHFVVYPSSAVGSQFYSFLHGLYCLYDEEDQDHGETDNHTGLYSNDFKERRSLISFDEEGNIFDIVMLRKIESTLPYPCNLEEDPFIISFGRPDDDHKYYNIDGRDICYATAKACTDALKKYGFKGYGRGTSCQLSTPRDHFDMDELLFVKAYALGVLEVRELTEYSKRWGNRKRGIYFPIEKSSFDKEMELLLFDM